MKKRSFSLVSVPSYRLGHGRALVLSTVLLCGLCACSSLESDPTYEDKQRQDLYKNGSLVSDSGGFSIFGDKDDKKKQEGFGVNAFLWRASLDTISFMPIASADPFGGLIATDWHSADATPNERLKLNVLILDRDLRADGVKVTVFRQVKGSDGEWRDTDAAPSTASALEDTILTRARQLRLAQKDIK